MIQLSIASDFSRYPGPRYRKNGEFSGQQFREDKLAPALRQAVQTGDILVVLLDDVAGYGSSFLEEAFGGLIRNGFTLPDVQRHLRIEARTPRFQHHQVRAQSYVLRGRRKGLGRTMSELVAGLVGAIVGALVAGGFQFWQHWRDHLTQRCDEFCQAVTGAGALAADYWAVEHQTNEEALVAEARLLGAQSLCDGLYSELKMSFDPDEADRLDQLMSELLDALTGGSFSETGRKQDAIRTRAAMQAASAVVVQVRRAHHNTLPFAAWARIAAENRHRH